MNQREQIWQQLSELSEQIKSMHLSKIVSAEPGRFSRYSKQVAGILVDFSKQKINQAVLSGLFDLAKQSQLQKRISLLVSGEESNITEGRTVGHTLLRQPKPISVIQTVLEQMKRFVTALQEDRYTGLTGKPITDILCLGIGGSDHGPELAIEALQEYAIGSQQLHFISNCDPLTLQQTLRKINPETTLCIISSKSFTTVETLENAKVIKDWLSRHLQSNNVNPHLIAVTAETERAKAFGIEEENIFKLWAWVGGRYSLWSAVGLPVAIKLGMQGFLELLRGAYEVDQHFANTALENNVPVLMALTGIWNQNFLNYPSLAVVPYADRLQRLPLYLQQLEMESNGKRATENGQLIQNYQTAPVVWGGVGCDAQHTFMQWLHQGTQATPIDFILPTKQANTSTTNTQQQLLVANCLAQSQSLMQGTEEANQTTDDAALQVAKKCSGDRPSTTFLLGELTPRKLGSLLAMYEHKVFVQGVVWQIASFDQWGVQLGKKLATQLMPVLQQGSLESLDASTRGLIEHYRKQLDLNVVKREEAS